MDNWDLLLYHLGYLFSCMLHYIHYFMLISHLRQENLQMRIQTYQSDMRWNKKFFSQNLQFLHMFNDIPESTIRQFNMP